MNLQRFLVSRIGLSIGLLLSRLHPKFGYRTATWLADCISSRKNYFGVRAVRANQWVVNKYQVDANVLDQIVIETYRNAARSLYEFWHYHHNNNAVTKMVKFEPSFGDCIEKSYRNGHGLIMVTPHFANFDMAGQAAAMNGYTLHVLSYPNPPGGYQWQNKIREQPNLKVTPISINSIRMASETLRNKGIVLTGIDRPLPLDENKYKVNFFGRKASLPVFHVRLALKHNVPIAVIGGRRNVDGHYSIWASDLIYMRPDDDLVNETITNAEKILEIVATDIKRAPDQWAMFYPVWPDTLDQAPA